MTIDEAIAQVDNLRPNQITRDIKIGWLSRVDNYIVSEIMANRVGAEIKEFLPYTTNDGDKVLVVPPPYDELYFYYLESQIYYALREIKKSASSMALYNGSMQEYIKKYMREHPGLPHPPVIYW